MGERYEFDEAYYERFYNCVSSRAQLPSPSAARPA